MSRQAYPAAHAAAPRVHTYFAHRHQESSRRGQQDLASIPDTATIERLIDAAFWASLRREEGYTPRISLAFLSPEQAVNPLTFERPLPLSPGALTRVAPAVERSGIHLGVWREENQFGVWGTTRTIPALCFVLEVAAPGLLVIKNHDGEELGKFVNVAVLEADQVKIVDERASHVVGYPAALAFPRALGSPTSTVNSVNILVQLAASMRAHKHGGSLLVVPAESESWRESIVWPMPYVVSPPFSELASLRRENANAERRQTWQAALGRTVDAIAGLTAVDGAVVLTDQYELLGFGAKIARRRGWAQVEQVTVTEPIDGGLSGLVHPEQLGGTRHLSAAQFVQDQRDAVALIASQDGRFTIFEWSAPESMVHAHRVEVLLL
jgi:hypothetical protein